MHGIISWIGCAVCAAVVCVCLVSAASAVDIETVPVGNPGNAGEWSGESHGGKGPDRICGAVDYEYNIGKYEVTAGQYTEFLNAVAATDSYGLYSEKMDVDSGLPIADYGCNIKRSGSPGNYTYSMAADWANRPVNVVSWGDAARFANWLHNGQPTGAQDLTTTEDGAYDMTGTHPYYDPDGSINDGYGLSAAQIAIGREADWKWAITSEDEWYKGAYYNPATSSYFNYPTGSNSTPSHDLVNPDPGNNANITQGGRLTIASPYYRTEVGEFENSHSPYGTFDQGGNVREWNEAILFGSFRGLRGGSFMWPDGNVRASNRDGYGPLAESAVDGFRVSEVPEPGSMAFFALGAVGMLRRRRNPGR